MSRSRSKERNNQGQTKARQRLTEKEMEELREQMMAAAKKRDEERKQNVKKYEEEKKKEEEDMKEYVEDFVRYDTFLFA